MPVACYVCEKAFEKYSPLSTHMRTHTSESPHFCEKGCKVEYRYNPTLQFHYKAKHKIENKPRRNFFERNCYFCPFSNNNTSKVATHILTHTNEVHYPCPFEKCKKRFKSFSFANKRHKFLCQFNPDWSKNVGHKTNANRLSKHVCYFCKAVYSSYDSLRMHLKSHTRERTIKC